MDGANSTDTKFEGWLEKSLQRMSLTCKEALAVSRAYYQGRARPDAAMMAADPPFTDPVTAAPMKQRRGNAVYCHGCKRIMSCEAAAVLPEDDDDDDEDLDDRATWRAAFWKDDGWVFAEPGGDVSLHEHMLRREMPPAPFPPMERPDSDFDGWMAANARAIKADLSRVVKTLQPPCIQGRCIWCRAQGTLIQCTAKPVCEGSLCLHCNTVVCTQCQEHTCIPSWSGLEPALVPVRGSDDFSAHCHDYHTRHYPKLFATHCQCVNAQPPPPATPAPATPAPATPAPATPAPPPAPPPAQRPLTAAKVYQDIQDDILFVKENCMHHLASIGILYHLLKLRERLIFPPFP